ncbi:reactive mitochondrial oxygen species modulator 1-domain-containing protein [Mycena amicta]|nr:reactive mitochondrial oxygen species modulator 1-domain-containing protein [Mycena amicta]
MGGGVGLTIGFLFGSWSILQHGAGPRGVLSTLSKTMLTSAASFSFFLAIGSVIRSEPLEDNQLRMLVSAPRIGSRAEGFQLMRARWEAERRRNQ